MRKKIIGLSLVLMMIIVLAGCGRGWHDLRRTNPRHQSSSIERIMTDLDLMNFFAVKK